MRCMSLPACETVGRGGEQLHSVRQLECYGVSSLQQSVQ